MSTRTSKLSVSHEAGHVRALEPRKFDACLVAHMKKTVRHAFQMQGHNPVFTSTCRVWGQTTLQMVTHTKTAKTWVGLDWEKPGAR